MAAPPLHHVPWPVIVECMDMKAGVAAYPGTPTPSDLLGPQGHVADTQTQMFDFPRPVLCRTSQKTTGFCQHSYCAHDHLCFVRSCVLRRREFGHHAFLPLSFGSCRVVRYGKALKEASPSCTPRGKTLTASYPPPSEKSR